MAQSGNRQPSLSNAELRKALEDAISRGIGVFFYDPALLGKLAGHNVSTQDLLHVCHTWRVMTPEWDEKYNCWRYVLEGPNLNAKWMRVVVAHNTVPAEQFVAITGFRYSRGKKS
ncbi:MAG: hypothetical protein CAF45_008065 [Nitrospira sp. CG24E]|nr:MAG: hypothetical protein CAF45_008065 [Nitrospira sp. CG24E]